MSYSSVPDRSLPGVIYVADITEIVEPINIEIDTVMFDLAVDVSEIIDVSAEVI